MCLLALNVGEHHFLYYKLAAYMFSKRLVFAFGYSYINRHMKQTQPLSIRYWSFRWEDRNGISFVCRRHSNFVGV